MHACLRASSFANPGAARRRKHKQHSKWISFRDHLAGEAGSVELVAADFASGAVRLTRPGRFRLRENVVFDPTVAPTAADGPAHSRGWTCAVSIESSDVVLDLGGHSLSQSEHHALKVRFFALVLLGSALFRLPTQGPFAMGGSELVERVRVRDGLLGRTSHFGVFSPACSDVVLERLRCRDFEVAGVQLNGAQRVQISNLDVGPSLRRPPVLGPAFSHLQMLVAETAASGLDLAAESPLRFGDGRELPCAEVFRGLQELLQTIERNLAAGRDPLEGLRPEDAAWLRESAVDMNGNVYGIAVNGGELLGGSIEGKSPGGPTGVVIMNCRVHDLRSEVAVWPFALRDVAGEVVRANNLALPHLRIDTLDRILLSPLTHGQLLLMRARRSDLAATTLLKAALSGSPDTCSLVASEFFAKGFSSFETDGMAHAPKGTCGIFLNQLDEARVQDVEVRRLAQTGRGQVRMEETVDGTSCTGILLSACRDVEVIRAECTDLASTVGRAQDVAATSGTSLARR